MRADVTPRVRQAPEQVRKNEERFAGRLFADADIAPADRFADGIGT
jgi:hypothetical protein